MSPYCVTLPYILHYGVLSIGRSNKCLLTLLLKIELFMKKYFTPRPMAVGIMVAVFALFGSINVAHADLTTTLKVGSRGAQVTELQNYLATNAAIYPQGLITGYFGSMTKAAVVRLQSREGLTADGIVGPITRARINTLIGGGMSGDLFAPDMSAVSQGSITPSSAMLTWTSTENTNGKIYYSTVPLIGGDDESAPNGFILSGTVVMDTGMTNGTSHSVTLQGLASHTTYYYRAASIDAAGNATVSQAGTFTTQ